MGTAQNAPQVKTVPIGRVLSIIAAGPIVFGLLFGSATNQFVALCLIAGWTNKVGEYYVAQIVSAALMPMASLILGITALCRGKQECGRAGIWVSWFVVALASLVCVGIIWLAIEEKLCC